MDKIISKPTHHYRIFFSVLIALAFLGVIIFANHRVQAQSATAVAGQHIITLHDDGVDKGFITKKATLREALAEQGIRVDANDRTEPGLDEKLVANSYQVNVYRARPVVIRDGNVETKIITAYRTAKQIAAQADIPLLDEDKVELSVASDPITNGAAQILTVTRATPFTFEFYGKTEQSYTMATTVADMLKEKGISLTKADGISPATTSTITANMKVRLWREGVQTVTVDEDVAFDTKQIKDADRDKGYKEVQTKGENGKRTVTYEINMQNGIEVSRKEINSNVTKQPIQQVEIIGTKVTLPAGSHEDWMAAAGISPSDYGYVNYIFTRESGWRPNAVSLNGYYGLGQTNLAKLSSACPNWESDPICQIRLFTSYANGYGGWAGSYDAWQRQGWW